MLGNRIIEESSESSGELTRLRTAEKRKDGAIAMMAHEMRNPLATILLASDLLKRNDMSPTQSGRIWEILDRGIKSLTRLADDLSESAFLLDTTYRLRLELVPLKILIRAAVESLGVEPEGSMRQIHLNLPEEEMYIEADSMRLDQVVANILGNAVKFTQQDGRIEISARAEGNDAVVTFADNGTGIMADDLDHIFDAYAQFSDPKGRSRASHGIGLALVKQLIELHGGTVRAESDGIDAGSRIIVTLPLTRDTLLGHSLIPNGNISLS